MTERGPAIARDWLALALGLGLTPVAAAFAVWSFPGWQVSPLFAAVIAFLAAALFPIFGLALASTASVPTRVALLAALLAFGAVLLGALRPFAPTTALLVTDTALVTLGWALGSTLGRRVQHASHLMPACFVAASADLTSLLSPEGPSHAIAGSERALSVLATWFPVPGESASSPALGVGDLLFMGLVLGVARAHALPYWRCIGACLLGTTLAGAAAAWLGIAVPALVPIAAAVVLLVPEARQVRRADRSATRLAMSIAGSIALLVIVRRLWLG